MIMDGAGKRIRWSRFVDERTGRGLIVPIDHGLTLGPLPGLDTIERMARFVAHPAVTGIIAHKGLVERLGNRGLLGRAGVMVHLDGMTSIAEHPDRKEALTTVESAIRLGADAVSVQLNFDGQCDAHNLRLLGRITDEARAFGLPVLTMLYDKVPTESATARVARQRHLIRACVELGTDALKLAAPQDLAEIPALLEGVEEHTAVFFAGGQVRSERDLFDLAESAVAAGAAGLCAGRNVFQREDVGATLARLREILSRPAREGAR